MKRIIEISLVLVFTLLMITFSQTSFAAECDALKPGQAAFYQHGGYKGTCVVRNMGNYSNAKAIGIGNDKISSIKMGPGIRVTLCNDSNFRGGCQTYTTNMASLGKMNDKTSSATVSKIPPPPRTPPQSANCIPKANQVAFFEHSKYQGACSVRNVGRYSNSKGIGISNDKISSIKMGPGTQVRLCTHSDFKGTCETYTSSMSSIGLMNDKTSSSIIENVNCDPKANQVAFFQHANYLGICTVRNVGYYKYAKNIGFGNDEISSIKMGPGTQVRLCADLNTVRGCETYTSNMASLGNMNDKTSSAVVGKVDECKATENNVVIYTEDDFRGECATLKYGGYLFSGWLGIGNDALSSLQVGKNAWAILCENSYMGSSLIEDIKTWSDYGYGNCETVYSPGWRTMSGTRVGDNTVSYMQVGEVDVNDHKNKVNKNSPCYPGDNSSRIAIFKDVDFRGECRILDIAHYNSSAQFGKQFADRISSIMLGENSKVYVSVYEHADYSGFTSRFFISSTNLTTTRVGNDSVSSIRIDSCEDSDLSECKDRYKARIPDKRVPEPSEAQEPDKPKVTVKRRE